MNYVKLLQKDTGLDKVPEIRTVIIEGQIAFLRLLGPVLTKSNNFFASDSVILSSMPKPN